MIEGIRAREPEIGGVSSQDLFEDEAAIEYRAAKPYPAAAHPCVAHTEVRRLRIRRQRRNILEAAFVAHDVLVQRALRTEGVGPAIDDAAHQRQARRPSAAGEESGVRRHHPRDIARPDRRLQLDRKLLRIAQQDSADDDLRIVPARSIFAPARVLSDGRHSLSQREQAENASDPGNVISTRRR